MPFEIISQDEKTIDVGQQLTQTTSRTSGSSGNTGYIRAIVIFKTPGSGSMDASDDIISITTDQGTSKEEGDATAKLTVTLHNNNNEYANQLIPQLSEVRAIILVERNLVNGSSLTVQLQEFPIYFGIVQEVQLNHETCVVECGDESSKMECADLFDLTFFPDQKPEERAQEILDSVQTTGADGSSNGVKLVPMIDFQNDEDAREAVAIQVESFVPSTQSGQSSMSKMLKDMALNWAVPSDREFRLMIFGKEIIFEMTDWGDLTDIVLDAGDSESIIGHCNVVTVISDAAVASATETDKNLIHTNGDDTWIEIPNEDSIRKYGKLESPAREMPYLSTMEEVENFAYNLLDIYDSYEDRTVAPTLVSFIPFLNDKFNYTINGAKTEGMHNGAATPINRDIYVKMLRKQVAYDSGGVVVQTECVRKSAEDEEGDSAVMLDKQSQLAWDALGSNIYNLWYKDEDGNIWVKTNATEQDKTNFDNGIRPDGFIEYDPELYPMLDSPYD